MKTLGNKIGRLEKEFTLLHSSKKNLLAQKRRKEITKKDHDFHKKINNSESHKKAYHKEISEQINTAKIERERRRESNKERERKPAIILMIGLIVILSTLVIANFEGITGFATFTREQTLVIEMNESYGPGQYEIELDLENATSLRVSGIGTGEGRIKVLLEMNGTNLTVLDRYVNEEGRNNLITGMVVGDEFTLLEDMLENNANEEVIEEENITEIVDNIETNNETIEIVEENNTSTNATTNETINENISASINENITNNTSSNITDINITIPIELNTSEELNITLNESINLSLNDTIEIDNELNITLNESNNESTNISTNVTSNTTSKVTTNVTTNTSMNLTVNATTNITSNITSNLTSNISANISENITSNASSNITDINITIPIELNTSEELNITLNESIIEELKTIFEDECLETCVATISNAKLIIIVEDMDFTLTQIVYTKKIDNKPPVQTKNLENISFYKEYEINASEYFADPDGDELIYDVKRLDDIRTVIIGNRIIFRTNTTGTYETYVYATDGGSLVKSNTFTIRTGLEENVSLVTEKSIKENVTQLQAEIGKPVKWIKTVQLDNITDTIINLPESSRNIIVKDNNNKQVKEEKISVVENKTRRTLIEYEVDKEIELIKKKIEKADKKDNSKESGKLKSSLIKLKVKKQEIVSGQKLTDKGEETTGSKILNSIRTTVANSDLTGRIIQEIPDAKLDPSIKPIEEATIIPEDKIIVIEDELLEENIVEIVEEIIETNETIVIEENVKEIVNETVEKITDIIEVIEEENITTINSTIDVELNSTSEIKIIEEENNTFLTNITETNNTTRNATIQIENNTKEIIEEIINETNKTNETIIVEEIIEEETLIETPDITQEIIISEEVINETEDIIIGEENNYNSPTNIEEGIGIIIEETAEEYIIEYETEAPEIIEEEINEYKKRVTISSTLHYTEILSYTNITPSPKESIGLHWLVNGSRIEMKNITYVDANEDGLVEKIAWITPHLSNQTFEITITVLNVQSYPLVGAYWTVRLNTSGQADLEITPFNYTTFWPEPNDFGNLEHDLEFVNFSCGNTMLNDQLWFTTNVSCAELNNISCYYENESNRTIAKYDELMQTNLSTWMESIILFNYTCDENVSLWTDRVKTPGAHYINFTFGPSSAHAQNWAVKSATSITTNVTVNIRRPGGTNVITGGFMTLSGTSGDTEEWHNTTWTYDYSKDCQEEGDYELYVEVLSEGNSETQKDISGLSEAITMWVDQCTIAGLGYADCRVHVSSKNTNADKDFGTRLDLMNSNCNITSVTHEGSEYHTTEGLNSCTGGECGTWIEIYHDVGTSDNTDDTYFDIRCDDGADDNTPMMMDLAETCGPSSCGEATVGLGGYDDCSNPTCTDGYTYIGDDSVESLGGFTLITYEIGILDTWDWNTVTTYNIDWDSSQEDCDCYKGVGYWNIGGDVVTCCEDDGSENKTTRNVDESTIDNGYTDNTSDDGCCDTNDKCVDTSICYISGDVSTDIDSDGDEDYCNAGTWFDCNTDSECAIGIFCNATNDCEVSYINLSYELPTPTTNTIQINNQQIINVSVSSYGSTVDSCTLEWNGINESMGKIGSGTEVSCNITKTTIDGTTYNYKVFANNSVGIINNTALRSFTENSLPTITYHNITPVAPDTTDDLNCSFTLIDSENNSLIAYYQWYNGTNQTLSGSVPVTSGIIGSTILSAENTNKDENWTCEITPYDNYENGTASNISRIINNSVASVTLLTPTDGQTLIEYTNRTPRLTWTASDPDGDNMSYTIWISEQSDFSTINQTTSGISDIKYTMNDLKVDTIYYWIVEAFDGVSRVNATSEFNFTIQSYESITFVVDTVNFPELEIGETNDTDTDAITPFKIRNTGNVFVNLSINASELWDGASAAIPSVYYRFKADEVSGEEGAFTTGSSTMSWTNMVSTATSFIKDLNFDYDTDEAEIDLYLTVPPHEIAGQKNSTISIST